MLATSPPTIFKTDVSKQFLEMTRHLATKWYSRLICQNRCQKWLATSPPRTFKSVWFKESLLGYARHLATKDFQDWFVKACIRTGSPPRHHWLFDSYDSKRDCLNMLATSPPMIFHGWYFKASVRNGSPPRHQGILNSYCSKRACLDMLATSPPRHFEFIFIKESLFGCACHLATNDFS